MALQLYFHPLASFCWKPLIALYESQIPFNPRLVDLGDAQSRDAFLKVWPMGEFPVIEDDSRQQILPQSTVIVEFLALYFPSASALIPADPELGLETRRWNEFFDTYVQVPMQKIVGDCLRPVGQRDATGVAEARDTLKDAYAILEGRMKNRVWCVGAEFTLADCSAAPALFYADKVEFISRSHPLLAQYLERLKERPSFARVLNEAKPYFHLFPYKEKSSIK